MVSQLQVGHNRRRGVRQHLFVAKADRTFSSCDRLHKNGHKKSGLPSERQAAYVYSF